MSTYGQKRDDEYLNRLKSSGPISDFITSYNDQSECATSDDLPVSGWHGLPTLARYRGCLSRSAVFLPYGVDRSIHLGGDSRQPADANTA